MAADFVMNPGALGAIMGVARTSPRTQHYTSERGESIKQTAMSIFASNSRGESGAARSPTTPPLYMESFSVLPLPGGGARVINTDPGAAFVEYGALAGGTTFVLGYAPLRGAVDSASSSFSIF